MNHSAVSTCKDFCILFAHAGRFLKMLWQGYCLASVESEAIAVVKFGSNLERSEMPSS